MISELKHKLNDLFRLLFCCIMIEKLTKKEPFVIPRIAGIENQLVVATDNLSRNVSIQQKNQNSTKRRRKFIKNKPKR